MQQVSCQKGSSSYIAWSGWNLAKLIPLSQHFLVTRTICGLGMRLGNLIQLHVDDYTTRLQRFCSILSAECLTLWASQWNCSTISPGCGISCEDSTWKCSNWKWKYSAGNAWDWPNGMAIARLGHTGACALGFAPQVQAHLKTRTLLCYMVDPIWWPEGRQASCRKLLLHWPYHQLLSKQEE